MEILEAFDLTGSLREAARLTGCSPMTVARYVRLRERGQVAADPVRRDQILDPYLAKLEEWVERSHGRVPEASSPNFQRPAGLTGLVRALS